MPYPVNGSPYGNILYPGGIPNSFPSQLGGTVSGRPYPGIPSGGGGGGHVGNPGRPRTVVVPYAVPVYYGGGYGYDPYYGQQQQQPNNVTVVVPQQPAPTVIINQTFAGGELTRQEVASDSVERGGLKVFEAPKAQTSPEPAPAKRSYVRDDKPNIYLIALKDSTVKEAIGYWVESGATLAFVTPEATITRVALDLVDRQGSLELNSQRGLDFELRSR